MRGLRPGEIFGVGSYEICAGAPGSVFPITRESREVEVFFIIIRDCDERDYHALVVSD